MKLVSTALVSAIMFSVAGATAAEKYLEVGSSRATDPWEVSDSSGEQVARVRSGIPRNDNPEELGDAGNGTIRFRFAAGEVSADAVQYIRLRYRSTNNGNNSVYTVSDDGEFVKHNLPTGNDIQWFDTEIAKRSTEDGSAEIDVMYREAGAEIYGAFVSDDPSAEPSTGTPGEAEPTPPPSDPPAEPDPVITPPSADVNGVREYPAIGIKKFPSGSVFEAPKGWLTDVWIEHMADALKQSPCAFSEHYPAMTARIKWNDAYVNPDKKPTREQARDPNWENYAWNKNDGISDALNSAQIDNGNGPGKLSILMSLSMTTSHDSPPQWMRKDSSLTWDAKKNADGVEGKDPWHVRFDNPEAVDHAADFMEAVLAKYGNNKGVHSIQLGETYLGPENTRPSGLNRGRFFQGIKELWNRISSAAPVDSNGTRVMLVQVSPWLKDGVKLADLKSAGFEPSESDMNLHLPVSGTSEELLQASKNSMHVFVNGDARYSCNNRRQGWDGTNNPFGHKKGHSSVVTPQEYFWYHSAGGPVPAHSIFITIAPNSVRCKGSVQTKAAWLDAIKTFGRCGSKADSWGGAPASR